MNIYRSGTRKRLSMINFKEDNLILRGPAPLPPGIYRIEDKDMKKGQIPSRCTCPHVFVTGAALGLLPSIALSSGPVKK